MGRAINDGNRLDDHEKRIKLLEGAMEELIQTRVHHVDLHDDMDKHEEKVRKENSVVVEPDEEFTAPVSKRKKVTTKPKRAESLL